MATTTMIKNEKKDEQIDYTKYIEEPWSIINSHFRGKHLRQLVCHQIESYNTFIRQQIPDTIAMFKNTHIRSDQDYDKDLNAYRYEMFINFENFK